MTRRIRCRMCGEPTDDPRTVHATPCDANGVNVPGARTQRWEVCPSCASNYEDEDGD